MICLRGSNKSPYLLFIMTGWGYVQKVIYLSLATICNIVCRGVLKMVLLSQLASSHLRTVRYCPLHRVIVVCCHEVTKPPLIPCGLHAGSRIQYSSRQQLLTYYTGVLNSPSIKPYNNPILPSADFHCNRHVAK